MSIDAILKFGPLSLLVGLLAMIYIYVGYRKSFASSGLRYFGMAFVVGIAAYVVGTAAGIYVGCSSADSGNLCGLYGVFGVGPLLAGLAIFLYSLSRIRKQI